MQKRKYFWNIYWFFGLFATYCMPEEQPEKTTVTVSKPESKKQKRTVDRPKQVNLRVSLFPVA